MNRSRRTLRRWAVIALLALVVMPARWAVPAHGVDNAKLVLVLDSSGSMKERVGGDRKIDVAKSALNTVVRKLPPQAQVGLRVYGATVFSRKDLGACADSQLVVPIGTANRPALRTAIARYKPYGETPISYSLKQAAGDLGTSGQRTIVLVSDGEETCNADPCVTAATIAKQGISLKIDVIGLRVQGRARSQLQCVAERGNGTYYDADNKVEIEESLDKLATRAFRPFTLSGTPIEGATEASSAPTAAADRYVDNIPGDDSHLYYRIPRLIRGSTLHASVTTLAGSGGVLGVNAKLVTSPDKAAQDVRCGWGYGSGIAMMAGGRAVVTAEVSSWVDDHSSRCFTDSSLLLDVDATPPARGKRFELVVTEEPPVVSTRHLPAVDDSTRWQPLKPAKRGSRAPVAGASFSDAPLLRSGTYQGSILTGENQVFAVNADWGQRVEVEATIAPRRGALAKELDVSNSMNVRLVGALRGAYPLLQVPGMPSSGTNMSVDETSYRVYAASPAVRYLNRGDSTRAPAAVAGSQYVVVTMAHDIERQFLVPYTLTVQVIGTAGEGKPDYVGQATPSPTPTPTPSPTPLASASATATTTQSAAAPGAAGGGVSIGTVVGVAAAALVLGAGGAAFALLRRRPRSRP